MTPLGQKIRALRNDRGVTLKDMARALRVSDAYLSALEHGHRGLPTKARLASIAVYFDASLEEHIEFERLAELSDPRVTIDTSGGEPEATEFANLLALHLPKLHLDTIRAMRELLP